MSLLSQLVYLAAASQKTHRIQVNEDLEHVIYVSKIVIINLGDSETDQL